MTVSRTAGVALLVMTLVMAACSDDDTAETRVEPTTTTAPGTTPANDAGSTTTSTKPSTTTQATFPPGGGVDLSLTRSDVDCSEEALGAEAEVFGSIHYVVEGTLGAVCFGKDNESVVEAWELLTTITPGGQLNDLGLFGGYVWTGPTNPSLAYVLSLDNDASLFGMAVNTDEAELDPDLLALTMAHEFAHVFTSLPIEMNYRLSQADCTTYYNGEACVIEGSLLGDWIETFWSDDLLKQIDPFDPGAGIAPEERCTLDPGFFGSYAATNPEEDFAETFSAFVFSLSADNDDQQQKMDWLAAQPGLLEFQDLVTAAGVGPQGAPVHAYFGSCGEASLTPAEAATYGGISLSPGFSPDAGLIDMISGGRVNTENIGCSGWAAIAPDLQLEFTDSTALLRFYFVADSGGDTTLIVNDPDGTWHCGDDSHGTLHPTIDFINASAGIYDIWVGSYEAGANYDGTLTITERSGDTP